jgi:hypothetical protein
MVLGMAVGEGSAAVAVAGPSVEGGGVPSPLPHAAMESSRNKARIHLINQLLISRVSASIISPESPEE